MTEYSGFRWAVFFLSEYANMFVVSGLAVAGFMGGWLSPIPGFLNSPVLGLFWFLKGLLSSKAVPSDTNENKVQWPVQDPLGPRLVWHKILSVCFSGLQRGHPENPYEKDLGASRFVHLMQM